MTTKLYATARRYSVSFPPEMFGLSEVLAEKYKKSVKTKRFIQSHYDKLITPYPSLSFEDGIALVASNDSETTDKMPWTVDMVKQLPAYASNNIIAETEEQVRIRRVASGEEGYEKPDDFVKNFSKYKKAYDVLNKEFKAETKEECVELLVNLDKHYIKVYNIVNFPLPKANEYSPKLVKQIDMRREQLRMLIEDEFKEGE